MLKVFKSYMQSSDVISSLIAPDYQLYISANLQAQQFQTIHAALAAHGLAVMDAQEVIGGWKLALIGNVKDMKQRNAELRLLSENLDVDIALLEASPAPNLNKPGVLFMDMDSTLIQCECIDEIADFLGIKAQISAITQSAMEGKLDFSESLIARVKLLAGLDESVLNQVYEERIRLTDGAERLINTVQSKGWKVGLVSGGFTFFTALLKERLNLDFTSANTLEIIDGKLTGRVLGNIVDANSKRTLLIEKCAEWDIALQQSVALGDGANDLPMLGVAGLGIAFHAKPKVRAAAPFALSHGGLDHTLHLLNDWKV